LWFKASPGKQFHKTLTQKTLHKNRPGGVAQGEGPEFKPQYLAKKKRQLSTDVSSPNYKSMIINNVNYYNF
jgi:hypothetical protein